MKPRLTIVSSHVRRAPSDRYAAIRAEMNNRLFNDVHGEMLERALLLALSEDDAFAARAQETY